MSAREGGTTPDACPFCGWQKVQCNELRRGNYRRVGDNFQVVCNRCKARGPLIQDDKAAAISAWSRRTPPAIRDDENHKATVEREAAFEEVAKWHDKNARLCLEASKDDPRLSADDRRRAFEAHKHHAASAAAIRNKMSDERRAAIRSLIKEDGQMSDWNPIDTAPEGVEIETKIDDGDGIRNVQTLVKRTRIPGKTCPMFWYPDGSMYVYYTPTHWRFIQRGHP